VPRMTATEIRPIRSKRDYEAALTEIERLADEDDPCFQRNTPVQILDVVVHQSDASGRDEMSDGFWRIRAVNE